MSDDEGGGFTGEHSGHTGDDTDNASYVLCQYPGCQQLPAPGEVWCPQHNPNEVCVVKECKEPRQVDPPSPFCRIHNAYFEPKLKTPKPEEGELTAEQELAALKKQR